MKSLVSFCLNYFFIRLLISKSWFFSYTISIFWFFSNHFIFHYYFFNQYDLHVFLNNNFAWFYSNGKIFLTTYFKALDFNEWSDLNSNSKNLFEILSLNNFLVDFSVCLSILFMALKILKFCSSELILINSQPSSFSIAFFLCIS